MKLHKKKAKIQELAKSKRKSRCTLVLATGSGKSKIGVDVSLEYNKTLIVVPTEKLRDERWKEEYQKWGHNDFYTKHIDRECYASLAKIDLSKYDLLVLDEAQNITPNNTKNFDSYQGDILGLTATPPRDEEKQIILGEYCPITFEYSLDRAVKDGVVAPYVVNIVRFPLENKEKNVKIETKKGKFYFTEKERYDWLTKQYEETAFRDGYRAKSTFLKTLNRMRFLYNLPSKLDIARLILYKYLSQDRSIIFGGSIKEVEKLCEHTFHSKTDDEDYQLFVEEKISKIGTINKLNEGADLKNLNSALIMATNSNPRVLIQRIGRLLRVRDNHRAEIWILCAENTQEEKWIAKAITALDETNVNYIDVKDL